MNWYYVREGKQDGPHSEETMRDLAKSGLVTGSTSIWREGMKDWESLAQAAPHLLAPPPPPPILAVGPGEAICGECGAVFPIAEMVEIRGTKVCARCKPLRLQKLQEGVATGDRASQLDRLLKIAKAQRALNFATLFYVLCYASFYFVFFRGLSSWLGTSGALGLMIVVRIVFWVIVIAQTVFAYRLASALGSGLPLLWAIGILFLNLFLIGLVLVLVLSWRATRSIKSGGFKVGLLGANPKEIEQAMVG